MTFPPISLSRITYLESRIKSLTIVVGILLLNKFNRAILKTKEGVVNDISSYPGTSLQMQILSLRYIISLL